MAFLFPLLSLRELLSGVPDSLERTQWRLGATTVPGAVESRGLKWGGKSQQGWTEGWRWQGLEEVHLKGFKETRGKAEGGRRRKEE